MMNKHICFLVKSLIFIGGMIAFLASFALRNPWLQYLGLPGWLMINIFVHEIGHLFGCVINHNQVVRMSFYWFDYSQGKLQPNNRIPYSSYCTFKKKGHDALVYIMGPTFSLCLFLISLFMRVNLQFPIMYVVLSALFVLVNCCPNKNSDLMMLISCLGKRS